MLTIKTLKTSNNPFRFRRQILELAQDFLSDNDKLTAIVSCYAEQQLISQEQAKALVEKDCRAIILTFSNIEQRLERIDEYRYRLEKRAADTARYMDSSRPGMANKIAGIISDIAKRNSLPILREIIGARVLGVESTATPTKRREPPAPRVVTPASVSDAALKQRDIQRHFHEARQVSVVKLQTYMQKQMEGHQQKHMADFKIDSVEDFVCFDHLRYIGSLGLNSKKVEEEFEVQFTNQYLDVHEFVECREFVVVRRS